MKLGVACDGWEIKSSDDIEEIAKLQCEPVEHEGCSVCDPLEIITGIPCYKTVFVDSLPEEGIQGIMYVVPNGDLYAVYMWDGEQFNAVTSSSILQALTVNPSTSAQDILPEQGYDGFSSVHVNPIPPEYIIPSGTKNITQNGNGQDVAAYEYVNVNVPTVTPTGEKTINVSQNGTVTEDVTNYASAKVVTNVPNTYAASDEGKVVQSGALVSQTSDTVTTNDTYDTTLINSLTVNVSGGGGSSVKSGTITPASDTLQQTIDIDDSSLTHFCIYARSSPYGHSKRVSALALVDFSTGSLWLINANSSGSSSAGVFLGSNQNCMTKSGSVVTISSTGGNAQQFNYFISGITYEWVAW